MNKNDSRNRFLETHYVCGLQAYGMPACGFFASMDFNTDVSTASAAPATLSRRRRLGASGNDEGEFTLDIPKENKMNSEIQPEN